MNIFSHVKRNNEMKVIKRHQKNDKRSKSECRKILEIKYLIEILIQMGNCSLIFIALTYIKLLMKKYFEELLLDALLLFSLVCD